TPNPLRHLSHKLHAPVTRSYPPPPPPFAHPEFSPYKSPYTRRGRRGGGRVGRRGGSGEGERGRRPKLRIGHGTPLTHSTHLPQASQPPPPPLFATPEFSPYK